ncbi:hypothetical protein AML91_20385 [Paenibacillus jilunlii]|uniref:Uncharacterized protein n=1 Tax=Paenibacillus jilunlii TaxID=682956 RepID=A0ABR5SQZ8_9BACL|nr:hypothetical protein AML91_20385 [Paenibacillus jilunlii]
MRSANSRSRLFADGLHGNMLSRRSRYLNAIRLIAFRYRQPWLPGIGKTKSAYAGRMRTPLLFLAGINNGARKQAGLLASDESGAPSQGELPLSGVSLRILLRRASGSLRGIRLQWRDHSGFAPRFPIKL